MVITVVYGLMVSWRRQDFQHVALFRLFRERYQLDTSDSGPRATGALTNESDLRHARNLQRQWCCRPLVWLNLEEKLTEVAGGFDPR